MTVQTPQAPLSRFATAALCAATLLLGACSNQELYSQLSERQANEMVAVLRIAGIEAEKTAHEGKFSVTTSRNDFSQAVRTLNAQGYPRESFDTMGKVFKREGFVSSPLEERARLMHAMSQEISNTIASIDGVVTARVHLVVPERNPLVDKLQPAAAAVFIKHRADRNLASQTAQIKALVVNSIEGLSYDNVTVALFPAESMPGDKAAPTAPNTDKPQASEAALPLPLPLPLMAGSASGALALIGGGLLWMRRRTPDTKALPAPTIAAALAAPPRKMPPPDMQAAFRNIVNRVAGRS
jgi:type III secretion protein J